MNPDERRIKNKGRNSFQGAAHIGIGVLYIVVGCIVGYYKTFGTIVLSNVAAYGITTLMVLYGAFRIYRGWVYLKPGK